MIQTTLPTIARLVIRFTVLGQPKSAGSKRAFFKAGMKRAIVIDDNAKAKTWQNDVRCEARKHFTGDLLTGPLLVRLVFYRPRPQGHFGKAGLNKAGASTPYPATKPDVLKLARAVEDALTEVVWRDDALIVTEILEKRWGEPARVEIEISPQG